MEKTIVGISTALGIGAISIIRVSGADAINYVNKIFSGNDLKKESSHTIHYGYIVHKKEKLDEVLVTVLKAPRTYTKEDVVEINCHGGIISTNKVLEALLEIGCELAEPGEFTKRAFLNGRIDLLKAEGVMNLIKAQTDLNHQHALNQLKGSVSKKISQTRDEVMKLIANIEVNIDYPEYNDAPQVERQQISQVVSKIKSDLTKILAESKEGKIIQEGIKTIIIGKPNVGKSSLLNSLIEENKAIVTEIAGTTRDIVEGNLNIGGVLLNIIDTAGIRKTSNKIEKIGVQKSLSLIKEAELVLFVIDNNNRLSNDEKQLLNKIKGKPHIVIVNKKDLKTKIDKAELASFSVLEISTFNKQDIEKLKKAIRNEFDLEKINQKDLTYLTSARSIDHLKKAIKALKEAEKGIDKKLTVDMLELDLKKVWLELGAITGEVYDEELLQRIFSDFCLGK